ncbi:STAS domain-containing protein [Leucobacter ruminantium]
MNLVTTDHGDFSVISIAGRLTASGAPLLRNAVNDLVDEGTARIVVDLEQTEFVDSSGLGALIGDLRIAAVPEAVQTVLRLTNLDRVLSLHPTPETAFDGR